MEPLGQVTDKVSTIRYSRLENIQLSDVQLSERQASLGIIVNQLRAPHTTRTSQSNMVSRGVSLLQSVHHHKHEKLVSVSASVKLNLINLTIFLCSTGSRWECPNLTPLHNTGNNHGAPIEGPSHYSIIAKHYGIEGFKGGSQSGPEVYFNNNKNSALHNTGNNKSAEAILTITQEHSAT